MACYIIAARSSPILKRVNASTVEVAHICRSNDMSVLFVDLPLACHLLGAAKVASLALSQLWLLPESQLVDVDPERMIRVHLI